MGASRKEGACLLYVRGENASRRRRPSPAAMFLPARHAGESTSGALRFLLLSDRQKE